MSTQELRELDAWVAEHVFKWDGCAYREFIGGTMQWRGYPPCPLRIVQGSDGRPTTSTNSPLTSPIPQYSFYRSDAMIVLERCVQVKPLTLSHWNDQYSIGCSKFDTHVSAPTLPLAICLAAKKLFSE